LILFILFYFILFYVYFVLFEETPGDDEEEEEDNQQLGPDNEKKIKEGFLTKKGILLSFIFFVCPFNSSSSAGHNRRNYKQRWFVLTSKSFSYYTSPSVSNDIHRN
jgi:hypothetical protein